MKFYKIEVSADTQEQADEIQDALLAKKLVTGGQIIHAPAKFWWKGKIQAIDYWTITSWTIEKHKQAVIDTVLEVSKEEVPSVVLLPMEGNQRLLAWIEETVQH